MKIKRTNVVPLIVYICTFVLFLGIEIAAVADIFFGPTTYDTAAINPIFFAFFFTLGLLLIALGILRSQRMFAGAGRGDDRLAPLAPAQPNKANAMAFGETLRLERTGRTSTGLVGATLVVAIILIAFLEFLFAPLYPDLFLHGFFGFFQPQPYIQPGQALWLEWVYMLLPVFLIAALMWQAFFNSLSNANNSKMVVTANDDGITTQIGMRLTRFIAWDDIHAFMRISGVSSNDDLSQYVLAGQHGFVTLPIQPSATFVNSYRMLHSKQITYEGGVEQYLANSQRLIATIATRGNATMRVPHHKPRINQIIPQNLPAYALTFPLAEAPWQPTPEAVAMMSTYQHDVGLYPDLVLPILWRMRRWSLWSVLFGFATFSPMIWNAVRSSSDISLAIASLIPFGIIIFTLSIIACFLGARMVERSAMPSITADTVGIRRRRGVFSGPGVSIPWQNVRAFGVILSTKMLPDPMYLLCTDTMTVALGWSEPKDAQQQGQRMTSANVRQRDRRIASAQRVQDADRRIAYANAASALHALIVARTGLPLRDLTRP